MRALLLTLLALTGAGCQTPAQEAQKMSIDADGLVVTVTAPETFARGGAAPVTVTVTNPTERPLVFCTYHTPFEGIRNDIFVVTAAGSELEYRGKMAKRAPPGPEDYIRLAPGEAKSVQVDLRDNYPFPVGPITVAYRGTLISGLPDSAPVTVMVSP